MEKEVSICLCHYIARLSLWMLLCTEAVLTFSREQASHSTSSGQMLTDHFTGHRVELKASDVTSNSSMHSAVTQESTTRGQENLTALFYGGPMMSNVTLTQHVISAKDCEDNAVIEIFGSSGEIHGISGSDMHNRTELQCWVKIQVPEAMYVSAILYNLMVPACNSDLDMLIYDETFSKFQIGVVVRVHPSWISPIIFYTSNKMYVVFKNSFKETSKLAKFRVRFQASNQLYQRSLGVVMTSPTSGHISPIGYNRHRHLLLPLYANATHTLQVPTDSVVITSFSQLDTGFQGCPSVQFVELRVTDTNGTEQTVMKTCGIVKRPMEIHHGARTLTIAFLYGGSSPVKGFQMLYSFHPENEAPARLPGKLFNCSVPHYASFKQHVHCNLEPECQGGEDEGEHCPFSPLGCERKIGYKDKCFALVRHDLMSSEAAEAECRKRGGRLAMVKTPGEWEAFLDLFLYGVPPGILAHLGMTTTDATMPDIYRSLTMWADGTVVYERIVKYHLFIKEYKKMPSWYLESQYIIYAHGFREQQELEFSVCEFSRQTTDMSVQLSEIGVLLNQTGFSSPAQLYSRSVVLTGMPEHKFLFSVSDCMKSSEGIRWKERFCQSFREDLPLKLQSDHFTLCPMGHVTHGFLSCVPDSQCGANYPLYSCTTLAGTPTVTDSQSDSQTTDVTDVARDVVTAMFMCENGWDTVHYTLLCDFRPDCGDGSDEAFCRHRQQCEGFTCTSGQCVGEDKRCDLVRNCVDGSDEDNCVGLFFSQHHKDIQCRHAPPAIIDFVYGGYFTQTPVAGSDQCPDTHFQCPGDYNYCLPVYVRCNGVFDCSGHEDELDCDSYTCPGHYRCRGSSVCLHADHLCDGLAQCPMRDDELLCEEPECPSQCRCQGLAFVCPRPFPTERFPELRYLDGTHSGLTFSNLTDQHYLVWLSLAQCGLWKLTRLELPNLQTVDLSDNLLTVVAMETFHILTGLRDLSLAGNPLEVLYSGHVNSVHQNLRRLDVSRTDLSVFDSSVFRNFSKIRYLNLSFSALGGISNSSFSFLPELAEIDLRGCPVTHFDFDLFSSLEELSVVFASNYKLCCEAALPDGFDTSYCFAPDDEVSSCGHLLKSDVYRALFWAMVIFAGFGNSFCYFVSMLLDRHAGGNHKTTAVVDRNFLCPLSRSTQLSGELNLAEKDQQPNAISSKIFLVNLNVADFLMAVSLAIVASADVLYSGQYALYDIQWKNTISCAIAGCLSVVSFSVSTFTVCLITLERCAAMSSGTLTFHRQMASQPSSARVACLIAWIFGIVLGGSPFLWQTQGSRFYGGTALCVPVLSGMQSVTGRRYYLGAVLVANFTLCCISAVGLLYVIITWRTHPINLSREVTISRFMMVVTSNVFCWLMVCFVGFLEYGGVRILGQVAGFVNMILIPVNAALNPYLYLLGVRAEKQEQKIRERLQKVLTSRVTSSKGHSRSAAVSPTTRL